jgi:archaellum component FlaC
MTYPSDLSTCKALLKELEYCQLASAAEGLSVHIKEAEDSMAEERVRQDKVLECLGSLKDDIVSTLQSQLTQSLCPIVENLQNNVKQLQYSISSPDSDTRSLQDNLNELRQYLCPKKRGNARISRKLVDDIKNMLPA